VGGEDAWLKIWCAAWKLMRKLQSIKQSIKANTTISVLLPARNPLKQTPRNMFPVTRQVKIAAAVKTTAKLLGLA
jgi:hypothetical protein